MFCIGIQMCSLFRGLTENKSFIVCSNISYCSRVLNFTSYLESIELIQTGSMWKMAISNFAEIYMCIRNHKYPRVGSKAVEFHNIFTALYSIFYEMSCITYIIWLSSEVSLVQKFLSNRRNSVVGEIHTHAAIVDKPVARGLVPFVCSRQPNPIHTVLCCAFSRRFFQTNVWSSATVFKSTTFNVEYLYMSHSEMIEHYKRFYLVPKKLRSLDYFVEKYNYVFSYRGLRTIFFSWI